MTEFSAEQSAAFIETFSLPPTGDGPLGGLKFAVKDLIDVAGHRTGCGNPTWRETHPPAVVSAVCMEQMLAAGATCIGKTITDELAFSLLGENHFYGTPLNPAAPDRVPGGSSSGSASAVACEIVDFALGTDTGGSVRIPASNCGIWGWRPTHGLVSVAGVMPLAPTYDTVGILAGSADVLARAAGALLQMAAPSAIEPTTKFVVEEAFALADTGVCSALQPAVEHIKEDYCGRVRTISLGELCDEREASDFSTWLCLYRVLMGSEAISSLGRWLDAVQPALGPMAASGIQFARSLGRASLGEVVARRERYGRQLQGALGPRDLLCLPTAPFIAPLKGSAAGDRRSEYYQRTLSLTAIAGVARLPQVSMPLARVDGAPIGLSLVASPGADLFLLNVAHEIGTRLAVMQCCTAN
jgi:amidase